MTRGPGRGPKGGVLLDLFLIFVILCCAGAAAVIYWRRGELPGPVKALVPMLRALPGAGGKEPYVLPDADVSDRSAWLQGKVRDLLTRRGVGEKHMLKAYNAERREGGIQWLEDTLEVRRPARFDEGRFMSDLGSVLAQKSLSLMDERREEGRWVLELGDRKRIFQRVIFER